MGVDDQGRVCHGVLYCTRIEENRDGIADYPACWHDSLVCRLVDLMGVAVYMHEILVNTTYAANQSTLASGHNSPGRSCSMFQPQPRQAKTNIEWSSFNSVVVVVVDHPSTYLALPTRCRTPRVDVDIVKVHEFPAAK